MYCKGNVAYDDIPGLTDSLVMVFADCLPNCGVAAFLNQWFRAHLNNLLHHLHRINILAEPKV
jgi:hypothetical protein